MFSDLSRGALQLLTFVTTLFVARWI